jgi:hypothetical protein
MSIEEILTRCRELGVKLAPGPEGRLRVSPPPEKLPEELRENLRAHKAAILNLLLAEEAKEVFFAPPAPCSCCRQREWWVSVYHVKICATCHPPATSELVAEWIRPRHGEKEAA